MNEMEIYISDLNDEKKEEVLAFLGIEKPEDANLDTFPLFYLNNEI